MRTWPLRRIATSVALMLGGLTAAVGALHLPVARPLLARFEALCPVNSVSPQRVERLQGNAVATLAGEGLAPSHETMGLRLVSGSGSAVEAWVRGRSFTCDTKTRGFRYVSCTQVPASALGRHGVDAAHDREVVMALDRAGKVVGVDILARTTAGSASDALVGAVMRELRVSLGEPHERVGSFDAASLDGPFRTATLRYRYADYVVTLSATNIPGSGVVVREQYLAAN